MIATDLGTPMRATTEELVVASRYNSLLKEGGVPGEGLDPRHAGGPEASRILWIDDEITPHDGSVWLLKFEGLRITCAPSGSEGLRLALTQEFGGIILDLRLPDLDGLVALDRLIQAWVDAPVLILSGWVGAEEAAASMRLGASDVKHKPLIGDELVRAVLGLVGLPRRPIFAADRSPQFFVHSARQNSRLIEEAARALARPRLDALDFVCLARRLRQLVMDKDTGRPSGGDLRERMWPSDDQSDARHVPGTDVSNLQMIVDTLEAQLSSGADSHEIAIASIVGMEPVEVAALIHKYTGDSFAELRRALRVRPTLRLIAYSEEQVAQIGYEHGYEYPSQFNREFSQTLGLPPRRFRHLLLRSARH